MIRLAARNLSCRRNGRTLFAGLSFALGAGGALALTGPNGVGKTSLLRILAGLLEPAEGAIVLEPAAAELSRAERALLISGRDPLKNALGVREMLSGWRDILFPGEGGDVAGRDVAVALDAFALTPLADTPCAWLSSGQRRRVSLARLKLSTAAARPLWLLDEPTNALDIHARALLADACAAHRAAGGIVIAATHDPLGWPGLERLDLASLTDAEPGMAADAAG